MKDGVLFRRPQLKSTLRDAESDETLFSTTLVNLETGPTSFDGVAPNASLGSLVVGQLGGPQHDPLDGMLTDPFGIYHTKKTEKQPDDDRTTGLEAVITPPPSVDRMRADFGVAPVIAKTWDAFYRSSDLSRSTLRRANGLTNFVLERPQDEIDAFIDESEAVSESEVVRALLGLATGRGSKFFVYNEDLQTFESQLQLRVVGCSSMSLSDVIGLCLRCGSTMRQVADTARALHEASDADPVLVAAASAALSVHRAVEAFVSAEWTNSAHVLSLFGTLKPAAAIVDVVSQLVAIPPASGTTPPALALLDRLYEQAAHFEALDPALAALARLLFIQCVRPWTDQLASLVGLTHEDIFWQSPAELCSAMPLMFVRPIPGSELLALDEHRIPSFIARSVAEDVGEIANCQLLIRKHAPQVRERLISVLPLPVDWVESEDDAKRVQERLAARRQAFDAALRSRPLSPPKSPCQTPNASDLSDAFADVDSMRKHIEAILSPQPESDTEDVVQALTTSILFQKFDQRATLLPVSLSPLLSIAEPVAVQLEMSNRLVLDIFKTPRQNIAAYAGMLRDIFLFANGTLAADLDEAIFAPDVGLAFDDIIKPWPPSAATVHEFLTPLLDSAVAAVARRHDIDTSSLQGPGFTVNHSLANKFAATATDALGLQLSVPRPLAYILTDDVVASLGRVFQRHVQGMRLKRVLVRTTDLPLPARHFINCYLSHLAFAVDYHWAKITTVLATTDASFGRLVSTFRSVATSLAADVFADSSDASHRLDTTFSAILGTDPNAIQPAIASFTQKCSQSRRPTVAQFYITLCFNTRFASY